MEIADIESRKKAFPERGNCGITAKAARGRFRPEGSQGHAIACKPRFAGRRRRGSPIEEVLMKIAAAAGRSWNRYWR
jgi:hypothetical protein